MIRNNKETIIRTLTTGKKLIFHINYYQRGALVLRYVAYIEYPKYKDGVIYSNELMEYYKYSDILSKAEQDELFNIQEDIEDYLVHITDYDGGEDEE
jgi:hypothetical protein